MKENCNTEVIHVEGSRKGEGVISIVQYSRVQWRVSENNLCIKLMYLRQTQIKRTLCDVETRQVRFIKSEYSRTHSVLNSMEHEPPSV
jgi:hypothetical protein